MHPCSSGTFQKDQEHVLKHPGSVDLISTNKTINILPSFIDRLVEMLPMNQFDWPIAKKTGRSPK
jgi:hypothetical protein